MALGVTPVTTRSRYVGVGNGDGNGGAAWWLFSSTDGAALILHGWHDGSSPPRTVRRLFSSMVATALLFRRKC
jgi:hypothetical protein